MMVECTRERRSNMRTEPSAPTEANRSFPRAKADHVMMRWHGQSSMDGEERAGEEHLPMS